LYDNFLIISEDLKPPFSFAKKANFGVLKNYFSQQKKNIEKMKNFLLLHTSQ